MLSRASPVTGSRTIPVRVLCAVSASTGGDVTTDVAPPPARYEGTPSPRAGYVWAPGYWAWSGHAYNWVPGSFIVERRGHWLAGRWEQVGAQWHYASGH